MSYDVKIVRQPSIFPVGGQWVDYDALSNFMTSEGLDPNWGTDTVKASEELPEIAGRLCYMSFKNPRPGGNKAYLGHILGSGHGSVLEHAVWNFIITGVSRSFTHEIVRHRVGFSYSQLSQRYVDESEVAFVVPPAMICYEQASIELKEIENRNQVAYDAKRWQEATPIPPHLMETPCRWWRWVHGREADLEEYRDQVLCFENFHPVISKLKDKTARRKAAREAARSVLPNCTETKIFVTANARSLRHFVELRGSSQADAEIRRVAVALLRFLQADSPNLFGDYMIDDTGSVFTEHRKV